MLSVQTVKQPINNSFIQIQEVTTRDERLINELSNRILNQPADKLSIIMEVRLFTAEIIIMAFEQAIITMEEDLAEKTVILKELRNYLIMNKNYYTCLIVIGCDCDLTTALKVLDAKLACNN